jgi:hypothetical protein
MPAKDDSGQVVIRTNDSSGNFGRAFVYTPGSGTQDSGLCG